jgi:solute carrier family 41
VAAGVVFDHVQHWEFYVNVKAIFTLIPALLGLKGNLEMTLASRLIYLYKLIRKWFIKFLFF